MRTMTRNPRPPLTTLSSDSDLQQQTHPRTARRKTTPPAGRGGLVTANTGKRYCAPGGGGGGRGVAPSVGAYRFLEFFLKGEAPSSHPTPPPGERGFSLTFIGVSS